MLDATVESLPAHHAVAGRSPITEPTYVKVTLIALVAMVLALLLVIPLVVVFVKALSLGLGAALSTFNDADAVAAIGLTLLVAARPWEPEYLGRYRRRRATASAKS